MATLVERGLRAQLSSGNLLTGELLVALDFHPESPPAELDESGPVPVIPSLPSDLDTLTASVSGVVEKIASLPLAQIGQDLSHTVRTVDELVSSPAIPASIESLNLALQDLQILLSTVNDRTGPLMTQAEATLASAEGFVGEESMVRYDLNQLIRELTNAARSIRVSSRTISSGIPTP